MTRESTYGLTSQRLADLLRIGTAGTGAGSQAAAEAQNGPGEMLPTLKMMPGCFRVLRGDCEDRQWLYVYASETTIGRGGDKAKLDRIRFAPSQVGISRRQAKLRYQRSTARFRLVNLADPRTKNSTFINGREMAIDQVVELNDRDRIRMGEVELEFRELPLVK